MLRRRRPARPDVATATTVLRDTVRGQRTDLVRSAFLVVGHQLSEASVPVVVGVVIDLALGSGDAQALLLWLTVVVGVFVVLASCGAAGYWLLQRAELQGARAIRLDVAARAVHEAGGALGRPRELVGLASSDADRAAQICAAVAVVAGSLAALTAGAAVLFRTSVTLAVAVLLAVVLVLVASRILARPLVGRAEAEQQGLARSTGAATDLVSGLRVLKGIGAEPAAIENYRRVSQNALRARLHAARLEGGYLAATGALSGGLVVLVAAVGGRLALSGSISIGELVAALGLAQFLMEPLERLTNLGPLVAGARGAAGRVAEVLGAAPAVRAGMAKLPESRGVLEVRHDRLDLTVRAGEHVGVVAADPSDALGLLAVLSRDADPAGSLEVDGVDLTSVTLSDARTALLVARHEASLFEGPLRENLSDDDRAGPEGAAERAETRAAVLAASAVDDVVDTLPDGLDTVVGEAGRTLSGGQRQRVALARALGVDPPILVLHDPTTAVDAVTEDRIARGLRRHRTGRTTILVTSSPALLSRCDRVLLVVDGAVAATGRHADLVADERYRTAVLT